MRQDCCGGPPWCDTLNLLTISCLVYPPLQELLTCFRGCLSKSCFPALALSDELTVHMQKHRVIVGCAVWMVELAARLLSQAVCVWTLHQALFRFTCHVLYNASTSTG